MFDQLLSTIQAHPVRYGAPVVAGAFLLLTFYRARTSARGPAADFWERLRSTVIPTLDALGRRLDVGYAAYTMGEREYAGTLRAGPEQAEQVLFEAGFRRNPLAAFKTLPDGREEVGSWSYRDGLLATHQIHVVLFPPEGNGTGTEVYAHYEYSSINPLTALRHYRGEGYSPGKGEERLHELLPEDAFLPTGEGTDADDSPKN